MITIEKLEKLGVSPYQMDLFLKFLGVERGSNLRPR